MEAIVATDINGGISKNGAIPWISKIDMKHFTDKTKGNICVMGRNTYLSLPDKFRPLPNRLNVVITNMPHTSVLPNLVYTNIDNLYSKIVNAMTNDNLQNKPKLFIIGGKQIYEQFISNCSIVWVTRIKKDYDCDLFFKYDFSEYLSEIVYEDEELIIQKLSKPLLDHS
jgi:dihydrofolate reductase